MTKEYSQLKLEQRYQIGCLLKAGKRKSEIAAVLGVDKSTIYRELKRNGAKSYNPEKAQHKTDRRHKVKPKHERFTDEMKAVARDWLTTRKWSPEFISAKGKECLGDFVSHESIYQWIWESKKSNSKHLKADHHLYESLKHGRRRRKRGNVTTNRGIIHGRIPIDKRPEIINTRKRIGDKEADIVLGKDRKPGLLILTDRKTRMNWIEKIESKEALYIERKIKTIAKRLKGPLKSITFDNDQAFTNHTKVAIDLGIKTYFTHPYTSQEKGTVENRIGVVRMFFPKGTDFTKVTKKQVARVEHLINSRPLRMFNYCSAKEIYEKLVV